MTKAASHTELDVSVVICTRNRAARLKQVLASAVEMRASENLRWELLVIDNGSIDNTEGVALGFAEHLPIRVIREDNAGLSHARNRGVREARGRYICWTDDDVVIDPNWLSAYVNAFARYPEAVVFGGRIQPQLEPPTPRWFAKLADGWPLTTLLAKRDFGDKPVPFSFEKQIAPWGANFAVRAAEQRRVCYEPGLGVSPHHKRVGEEAEVIYRILQAGGVGWWVPEACVRHIIPAQRQTLRYVYDYFLASGETVAYLEATWPGLHHQSANRRDMARVRLGRFWLYGGALVNAALFGGCWSARMRRRGLKHLTLTAFYIGIASFRPREAASTKEPTCDRPLGGPALQPAKRGIRT